MDGETLTFSCEGAPRGQGRPRTAVRGRHAVIYKDAKSRIYEESIAKIAAAAMKGRKPFTGALSLSVRFRLEVPKSTPKKERARILSGEQPYFGAFDTSNMIKALEDAMNRVVYEDDRQIVRIFATKEAAPVAGLDVKVMCLEPQPR